MKNLMFFYDLGRGNRPAVAKNMKNQRFFYVLRWGTASRQGAGRAPSHKTMKNLRFFV